MKRPFPQPQQRAHPGNILRRKTARTDTEGSWLGGGRSAYEKAGMWAEALRMFDFMVRGVMIMSRPQAPRRA
eukprot:1938465-Pyramimonas_sp.AAC.1